MISVRTADHHVAAVLDELGVPVETLHDLADGERRWQLTRTG